MYIIYSNKRVPYRHPLAGGVSTKSCLYVCRQVSYYTMARNSHTRQLNGKTHVCSKVTTLSTLPSPIHYAQGVGAFIVFTLSGRHDALFITPPCFVARKMRFLYYMFLSSSASVARVSQCFCFVVRTTSYVHWALFYTPQTFPHTRVYYFEHV